MRDMFNINFLPRRDVPYMTWITKEGKKIHVTEMNMAHLVNAYKFCERQVQVLNEWMDIFNKEAKKRGFQIHIKSSWLKRRVKR